MGKPLLHLGVAWERALPDARRLTIVGFGVLQRFMLGMMEIRQGTGVSYLNGISVYVFDTADIQMLILGGLRNVACYEAPIGKVSTTHLLGRIHV